MKLRIALLAAAALVAACGTQQQQEPAGRTGASGSLDRYAAAYFKGDARAESAEFERARSKPARAELMRCAVQVASLDFEPCTGFERIRRESTAADRAYADYIAGRVTPADVPLVPVQHRAIAAGREDAGTLMAIADPTSRLVAAGVLLRTGRATPQVVQVAVDTASQQGWRRPLVAWLGLQAQRAERSGHRDEAERIRKRIAAVNDGH